MRAWLASGVIFLSLVTVGCQQKRVQAPAPPTAQKASVFALLESPDRKNEVVVVENSGGSRELRQPNEAVRVERAGVRPSDPLVLSGPDVQRLFGGAQTVLPAAEARFVLYFDEGKDELTPESEAQIAEILAAIQARRSTLISVTGHTDTTADPKFNYQLGLRRAERVANTLGAKGVNVADLFVESHGQADLLVPTGPGVAERRNRRVEVIVR